MTDIQTTSAASAFAPSQDADNGDNKPENTFASILRKAYKFGLAQTAGEGAPLDMLSLVKTGVLEGEIEYIKPVAGRKAKGVIDNSHIGQIAAKHIAGVVKEGGNASKATQKNRLNQIGAWCAGPDSREQASVWDRAVAKHDELIALAKNDTTVRIYGLAAVMLRISALYTKKGGSVDRTTPLNDTEIEACIRRTTRSKEYAAMLKTFLTHHTKELEEQGGDAAEEEYKDLHRALNAQLNLLTQEYAADAQERVAADLVNKLVATGVYVPTKNGGFKLAA